MSYQSQFESPPSIVISSVEDESADGSKVEKDLDRNPPNSLGHPAFHVPPSVSGRSSPFLHPPNLDPDQHIIIMKPKVFETRDEASKIETPQTAGEDAGGDIEVECSDEEITTTAVRTKFEQQPSDSLPKDQPLDVFGLGIFEPYNIWDTPTETSHSQTLDNFKAKPKGIHLKIHRPPMQINPSPLRLPFLHIEGNQSQCKKDRIPGETNLTESKAPLDILQTLGNDSQYGCSSPNDGEELVKSPQTPGTPEQWMAIPPEVPHKQHDVMDTEESPRSPYKPYSALLSPPPDTKAFFPDYQAEESCESHPEDWEAEDKQSVHVAHPQLIAATNRSGFRARKARHESL